MSWPPEDAGDLLERWRELGSPEIPLSQGVGIVDLVKWLDPMMFLKPSEAEMDRVRAELGLETAPESESQPEGQERLL